LRRYCGIRGGRGKEKKKRKKEERKRREGKKRNVRLYSGRQERSRRRVGAPRAPRPCLVIFVFTIGIIAVIDVLIDVIPLATRVSRKYQLYYN